MANGRNKSIKSDSGRDSGGFVALPWAVLDSSAYAQLSMHARALLLEVARQILTKTPNNGRLLLSRAYMDKRGWKSVDMLTKAKTELLARGFIFETVIGHRPNKASWYAVTWRSLDKLQGFDDGAAESFRRGAYLDGTPLQPKPTREDLYKKWNASGKSPKPKTKNASLVPPHGTEKELIVPPHGTEELPTVPPHGSIEGVFTPLSVPPHGHHLDMPSIGAALSASGIAVPHEEESKAIIAKVRRSIAQQAAQSAMQRHATRFAIAKAAMVAPRPQSTETALMTDCGRDDGVTVDRSDCDQWHHDSDQSGHMEWAA